MIDEPCDDLGIFIAFRVFANVFEARADVPVADLNPIKIVTFSGERDPAFLEFRLEDRACVELRGEARCSDLRIDPTKIVRYSGLLRSKRRQGEQCKPSV